jgi:hypothetical protein
MHRAVDRDRRTVDGSVTLDHLAGLVHAHQITAADHREMHAERIDPERVRTLGVTHRDMAGHSLVQAGVGEHPERGRKLGLAMSTLLLDGLEDWRAGHVQRSPVVARDRCSGGGGDNGVGHDQYLLTVVRT